MSKKRLVLGVAAVALAVDNIRKRRRRAAAEEALWTDSGTSSPRGTALITGASSGIGEAFAWHLAARGCNLVLVARREEKLAALARMLQERHHIQAEVMVADLAKPEEIARIETRVGEIPDLAFLINNAGFGTAGNFAETDAQKQFDMVELHVVASVRLCKAALPGMVARHWGNIVNVSSLAGFAPLPGRATYSSTKAYLTTFSQALHLELKGTGVRMQALCPGFTRTEFQGAVEHSGAERTELPEFMWMSAEDVVADSLKALEEGSVVCIPGLGYQILGLIERSGLAFPVLDMMGERLIKRFNQ